MIEPKIVIFFNLLIAASDYNFGAPVTEWPSRCLADKRNFKKKQTTTTNKQNKTKIRSLNQSTLGPAIRSCDTGKRIPCCDSCQLTTTWLCSVGFQAGYRVPLAKKCHISQLFSCGEDGWQVGLTYGHLTTNISQMEK